MPVIEPRTGAWASEIVERARHIGLCFVAITQQRRHPPPDDREALYA